MKEIKFLDIETTHLNEQIGEIIEIAILTSMDGGRTFSEKWQTKIKPSHIETADPKALLINGYNPEEWQDAPTWEEIHPMIGLKLRTGFIVAHNANYESRWIEQKLKRDHGYKISWLWICTKTLSYEHLPWLRSHSLTTLRDVFNLSHDGAHTAAKDAEDTAHVYSVLNRCTAVTRLRLQWQFEKKRRGT